MQYLDIIIYAAIAAFALFKLWSLLGQKGEDEPQRQNPYAKKPDSQPDSQNEGVVLPTESRKENRYDANKLTQAKHAPDSLAGILSEIQRQDQAFEEKRFLAGAKTAFKIIVEDFAAGDLSKIGKYLAPNVVTNFEHVIEERKATGLVHYTRIDQVQDAEIVAARLDGQNAFVTVFFKSVQVNCLKNTEGKVVDGDANLQEIVEDTWIFRRDLCKADPNWILAETKA